MHFVILRIVPACLSDPCDINAICEREGLLSDHFIIMHLSTSIFWI